MYEHDIIGNTTTVTGSVTLALGHLALAILAKKNANCLANSWLYFMNPN